MAESDLGWVSNASSQQKWRHSTLTVSIVLVISMNKHVHTLRGKCSIDGYSWRYLAFPIVNSRLNVQNAPGVCPYCDCQLLKNLRIEWNRKDLTLQKSLHKLFASQCMVFWKFWRSTSSGRTSRWHGYLGVPLVESLDVDEGQSVGSCWHDSIILTPCHQTNILFQVPLEIPVEGGGGRDG